MKRARAWGFDYLKLDFLYAGALPGKRHEDMPREAAYRHGLEVVREAMGTEAYLLACGAPIIPSLGICDALRIGPDVAAGWESHRDSVLLHNPTIPGTKNAIRTAFHRLWLRPLVQLDPDVAYFRSIECGLGVEQKSLLQSLALICGLRATSDLPQWLSDAEHADLRDFLQATPGIKQIGPASFQIGSREVNFGPALDMPESAAGWTAIKSSALGWLGDHGWAMRYLYMTQKATLRRLTRNLQK
jgi:alpha-galactosidase